MTPTPVKLDELPLDVVEQIDGVCVRFEAALKARQHPVLAAYLNEVPEACKTPLLQEMLRVELEYRIGAGEDPSLEEYLANYPDYSEQLRLVFAPSKVSSSSAVDLARREPVPRFPPAPSEIANYRIVRELGRGGMGVVYEAVQSPLRRHVALKVLAPKLASGSELERFRREAEVASRLHHTNIVPIYEAGQHGDTCFYAMQLIHGQDLHQFISHMRALRGRDGSVVPAVSQDQPNTVALAKRRLPAALQDVKGQDATSGFRRPWPDAELTGPAYYSRVAEIGLQAAAALAFAHAQGVIHRDVKPTNLMLDGRGTVWVTDFGLVKTADSDLTSSGAIVGTLRYLAPERLQGSCDARSDTYSLGLSLYELAVLRPAFTDTDHIRLLDAIATKDPPRLSQVDPRVPRDLETILLKAIDKTPARRYASADDLAEDLRRFLAGEPILARRTSTIEKVWIWAKRHPLAALGIALIVLALVLVAGMSLWTARQAVENEENTRKVLNEVEMERDAKDRALHRAEGLRLIAQSEAARVRLPALALLLAIEGAQRAPGLLANNAMQEAIDQCREMRSYVGHDAAVFSASFSADGQKILTCSDDGTARVWDTATAKPLLVLQQPNLVKAAFSPDGRRIVTLTGHDLFRRFYPAFTNWGPKDWGTTGPKATLWNAATGQRIASWQSPRPQGMYWFGWSAGISFSPDSRHVVTYFAVQPDGHPEVRDVDTGKQVAVLQGDAPVMAVAYSPDNRTIATASADQTVRLWEAASGRQLHVMTGHSCMVRDVVFNADGRLLLTFGTAKKFLPFTQQHGYVNVDATDDAAATVWDVASGKQVSALAWPDNDRTPYLAGTFLWNSQQVVLANWRGRRMWTVPTGKPDPPTLPTHLDFPVYTTALGPDGLTTSYAGLDRTPRILAGSEVVVLRGHEDTVHEANFNHDGTRLVTASGDGTARLWAAPFHGYPALARTDAWATPFASLSPDGRRLLVRQNATPRGALIDTSDGRTLAGFECFPAAATFTKEGREAIVVGPGGSDPTESAKLHFLDAETGQVITTGNDLPGRLVALSPDHRLVLLGHPDATKENPTGEKASVWDLARRIKLCDLQGRRTHPIENATFSPDGTRLITRAFPGQVPLQVWDTVSGNEFTHVRTAGQVFWWAEFVDDGRQFLAFYADQVHFRLFESATGKEVRAFTYKTLQPGHLLGWKLTPHRLRLLHLSPERGRLLCPTFANTNQAPLHAVGLWDLSSAGEPVVKLIGHTKEVTWTCFSRDGRHVLTGAEDRTARLWDAASGKEVAVFKGHQAAVTCGHVDDTGEWLVTASLDGTVRTWSVRTGRELAQLRWPYGAVEEVRFTPDAKRVCIRARDVTRLWDLDILAVARSRVARALTPAERERYEIPAD